MSVSGARGIARVAENLDCHFQAAMVIDRVREPDLYRQLTGQEYPAEYGERASARRRGMKFEENLNMNNAGQLRRSLAAEYGLDADALVVRNLDNELPGSRDTIRSMRLRRTRGFFEDLAKGKEVPDIVIQPQLHLPVPGAKPVYISPDFMFLDRRAGIYRPGEDKSFMVLNNVVDPADLKRTRLQGAVEILALRAEAERVGLQSLIDDRAIYVFATPYGLRPHPPFEEDLGAEIYKVQRAIVVLSQVASQLSDLRKATPAPLQMLAGKIQTHFKESCTDCVLMNVCKREVIGRPQMLGDTAAELLGPTADLQRLLELLGGAEPTSAAEAALLPALLNSMRSLGYERGDYFNRRLA
jgi:hypothetical protein